MSKTGGRQIARESPTARPWPISSDIRASRMRNLASGGGPSGFHPAKTCTPGTRGRGSGPYPYANRAVRRLAGRHQSGGQLQRFNMDEIVAAGVDKHRREIHFFGHCLEIGQFCTPVEQSSEEHRRNTVNNRNQPRIPELTLRIETTQRQIRSQISQRRNQRASRNGKTGLADANLFGEFGGTLNGRHIQGKGATRRISRKKHLILRDGIIVRCSRIHRNAAAVSSSCPRKSVSGAGR